MLTVDRITELMDEEPRELTDEEWSALPVEEREEHVVRLHGAVARLRGFRERAESERTHEASLQVMRAEGDALRRQADIAREQALAVEARLSEELEDNLEGLRGDPRVVAHVVAAWRAEFGSGPDWLDLAVALTTVLGLDLTDAEQEREVRHRISEARQMGVIVETFDVAP